MKSLIRKAPPSPPKGERTVPTAPVAPSATAGEAQCCAKVSKTVAGCHD